MIDHAAAIHEQQFIARLSPLGGSQGDEGYNQSIGKACTAV
jgi:hypothetical protein